MAALSTIRHYTKTEIDNTSRSMSLCEGLVNRIFKDVHIYQKKLGKQHCCATELIHDFNNIVKSLGNKGIKKSRCRDIIISEFFTRFHNDGKVHDNKSGKVMCNALLLDLDQLFLIELRIDEKRPHRSKVFMIPFALTKHVLARFLYRIDSSDFYLDIRNIVNILYEMFTLLFGKTAGKRWLYLPHVGGLRNTMMPIAQYHSSRSLFCLPVDLSKI
jgi:hypothetical protein